MTSAVVVTYEVGDGSIYRYRSRGETIPMTSPDRLRPLPLPLHFSASQPFAMRGRRLTDRDSRTPGEAQMQLYFEVPSSAHSSPVKLCQLLLVRGVEPSTYTARERGSTRPARLIELGEPRSAGGIADRGQSCLSLIASHAQHSRGREAVQRFRPSPSTRYDGSLIGCPFSTYGPDR